MFLPMSYALPNTYNEIYIILQALFYEFEFQLILLVNFKPYECFKLIFF